MEQKRILLVIGGGIAAYKSLELIRELGRRGIASRCIVTKAGQEFVTPTRPIPNCSTSMKKPRWAISSSRALLILSSFAPPRQT